MINCMNPLFYLVNPESISVNLRKKIINWRNKDKIVIDEKKVKFHINTIWSAVERERESERGGGGLIFTYFSKGFQMGARV